MKNGNTPINAVFDEFGHITGESCSETGHADFYGLTKREYFAGLAMQGLIARTANMSMPDFGKVADYSAAMADALLAELEKEQQ